MLAFLLLAAPTHAGTNVAATLIPFSSLSPTNRALVHSVTDHYTLRREYDAREFKARKQHVDYLMDHLDACSVLAETVGLIQYRTTLDAQGRFFADNHEGARGYIVETYSSDGKRIYFVHGTEQGVFKVEGRGVAVIDYSQTNTNTIRYTGAMFVKVDNVVIAALAQLFGVFVRGTVDHHFDHVLHHPITLSEMALSDPQFLLNKIRESPEPDRTLLAPFAELLAWDTNNLAR
jgi:hypothetical protein